MQSAWGVEHKRGARRLLWAKMKILITGGAGFIGSHLAERLLEQGDEVFIIDNLWTGRLANITKIQVEERLHLVVDTILNESVMNELIFKADHIYHLAAAVGVRNIMDHPVETLDINVKGSEVVLRLANRFKKKVFIASTSEIYGKHLEHNLSEDDNRVMGTVKKRRWAYACSKTLDEFLALAYFDEKKLPVSIRWDPGRRVNMGWFYLILCRVLYWESRSRSMVMGHRPGVSRTWMM